MNLEHDLREQIFAALPHLPADRPDLEAKPLHELLVIYLNWVGRLVVPRQRRAFISKDLMLKRPLADADQQAALTALIEMIESGRDLTAHLSRSIETGFVPAGASRGNRHRPDLDLMLNDWGVHHLHLSRNRRPDGFVERTGPLLFAVFRSDAAYMIDIVPHGRGFPDAWTTDEILKIMARNWPDAGLMLEMKGFPPGQNPTPDERRALRANRYASQISIDGRTFMPFLGLTSAGTSTLTSIRAIRIMRHMPMIDQQFHAGVGEIWDAFRNCGVAMPAQPCFRFAVYIDGYGVLEEVTQTFVRLVSW